MQIGADFEGLLEIHVQKYRKLYTAIDNGANEILQQNRHFSLRSMFCISCFFLMRHMWKLDMPIVYCENLRHC